MANRYDKMDEYIASMFNVFQMVNAKAERQRDQRLKMVGLMIYNYVRHLAKKHEVDLKSIPQQESINLIPVFEYVAYNDIELYDFSAINVSDVDTTKEADLERFALTHVYYITQGK